MKGVCYVANEIVKRGSVDWKGGIYAGLIAGLIFLILEMLMVPLFGDGSPWGPPRMIAAIVLGEGVLPPPATFDLGIVMVAMLLHFALSILYALTLAFFISRMSTGSAITSRLGFGLVLYLVNFYLFTAMFPWFAMARNWISVFAHLVFGLVAAWSYKGLQGAHHEHSVGRVAHA